ncbi:MAG: DUF1553 domain-containing protein [Pirellulaceae bacterium]|nr:DUF1553 domain-containing protein [Pirellulaceae bacterium]
MLRHWYFWVLLPLVFTAAPRANCGAEGPDEAGGSEFDRRVAPLLAAVCLDCHQGPQPEGGLDLSRREAALAGGDSGPPIVAGKPAESLMWQRIESGEMPPKHKLSDSEKQLLRGWIERGARWGADPIDPFRFGTARRAGRDWWSLQPLAQVAVPEVRHADRVRNPIDAFLLQALEAQGLEFSPDAEPRVLVRRLSFDLLGLPPDPEEVERFRRQPTEEAYSQLVDRLLDSPHYGERWGRHWLDVARFGESDGFERNNPRHTLWPYRDWVIQALNEDLPYDQFARWQIAGDVLSGGSADGLAAAGFLVAGVHNTVVGSSESMRRQAREDELEEIVGTLGQTFLGLTFNCGRCHDHKFDPIQQAEYYRLTAAIGGVNHGEREVPSPEAREQLLAVRRELGQLAESIRRLEQPARRQVLEDRQAGRASAPPPPAALAHWEFDGDLRDSIGSLHGKPVAGARLADGALLLDGTGYVETPPLANDLGEKTLEAWVELDNLDQRGGAAISVQTRDGNLFDAIVFGEREARHWMAGSEFFRRTASFEGTEEHRASPQSVHVAIVYQRDGTIRGYRDGVPYGKSYQSAGLRDFSAGTTNVVFGLRHAPPGGNKHLTGKLLRARLYDRALSAEQIAASHASAGGHVTEAELVERLGAEERAERQALRERRKQLLDREQQLAMLEKLRIYTVDSRQPPATYLLHRGNVMDRGEVVEPGGVAAVSGVDAEFHLPPDATDAERRKRLAMWITDRKNGLFARVIVNRVWHYHFGTGLVETPNDLGFNGGRPSHPELLDWLAARLIQDGYRLKPLHRLIVQSTAWRQASAWRADAHRVDAGNRLLWRFSPRRMEAEVVRDSMLQISGRLNPRRGGPGFQDVTITPNNGTTYYDPIDREDEALNRRTVYRFWPRGGRSALLDTFDCPDPSTTAPRRSATTTPLQALSLLNNPLVLRMSDHLGRRLEREAGQPPEAQVERAFDLVYNRPPDDEELRLAAELIRQHGASTLARALFNSNEFVIIE